MLSLANFFSSSLLFKNPFVSNFLASELAVVGSSFHTVGAPTELQEKVPFSPNKTVEFLGEKVTCAVYILTHEFPSLTYSLTAN